MTIEIIKKAIYQDMAEKYGTSKSNVAHIVLGIDWKYLNLKPIYKGANIINKSLEFVI